MIDRNMMCTYIVCMFGFYEFCLLFSFSGPYSLQQAVSAAVSSYRWDQFSLDNRTSLPAWRLRTCQHQAQPGTISSSLLSPHFPLGNFTSLQGCWSPLSVVQPTVGLPQTPRQSAATPPSHPTHLWGNYTIKDNGVIMGGGGG